MNKEDKIPFLMEIRGIQKKLVGQITNWSNNEANVTFDLNFPVLLKDFDLKRPSFLGLLKVGEKVEVTAHFTLYLTKKTKESL